MNISNNELSGNNPVGLHVIDAVSEAIGIVDENEKFIYANKTASLIFEVNPSGLINHYLSEFLTSDNFQIIKNETLKRKNGYNSQYIIDIITGKGKIKSLKVHAFPHYVNGQFAGTIGIFNEIKNINTESNIKEIISNRFELLIETMNEGFIVADENFRISYVNSVICKTTKYHINELIGKKVIELIHPDDHLQFSKQLEERKKGIKSSYEINVLRSDNQLVPTMVNASPIMSENQQFIGSIAVVTDMSERNKIMNELKHSEEKFRTIMELLPDTVSVFDHLLRFKYISPAIKSILGYTEDELADRSIFEIIHPDDNEKVKETFRKFIENHENIFIIRTRIRNKKGEYHWFESIGKNHIDNRIINGIIVISRMIDSYVAELNELEDYLKRLTHLTASNDQFFSLVSHQLINPFNSLIGLSDLLSRNAEKYPPEKIKQFADLLNHTSRSGFRLIENILYWSRFQGGRIDINLHPYPLETLFNEAISALASDALKKQIKINSPETFQHYVYTDRELFSLILKNLISNAIKYSFQNNAIDIECRNDNGNIEISVKDYGVGIKPENLKKILNIETIFTTPGTAYETGAGMGLKLCSVFTEKLHGSLLIESKENGGTKVVFTQPSVGNET